jgi:DnaJ-domain-containing protein 1
VTESITRGQRAALRKDQLDDARERRFAKAIASELGISLEQLEGRNGLLTRWRATMVFRIAMR